MEVPADVCTFPCDKPCNPPSSPTAPSSPPPRLIEDFLFSHPSNNLNLPVANTPHSPRYYTALQMAGLSVHTKLVLGPRRACPSLALRPGPPHQLRAAEEGRPGRGLRVLDSAVRHLLASPVNVPGFVLQQLGGDCKLHTQLCGREGARACRLREGGK